MVNQVICTETVSIVRALILGADGACIDIGIPSVTGAALLFVGAVVALRYLGAKLVRHMMSGRDDGRPKTEVPLPPEKDRLQRMPYESPIRSTGAWGRKRR